MQRASSLPAPSSSSSAVVQLHLTENKIHHLLPVMMKHLQMHTSGW